MGEENWATAIIRAIDGVTDLVSWLEAVGLEEACLELGEELGVSHYDVADLIVDRLEQRLDVLFPDGYIYSQLAGDALTIHRVLCEYPLDGDA